LSASSESSAYPLLAYGTIPWYDYLFGIFALQIICTWLYNGAGASVLIAMIAHLFSNLLTATVKPLFSTADQERYWLIMVAVECLTTLGILIATSVGSDSSRQTNVLQTSKGNRAATRTIRRQSARSLQRSCRSWKVPCRRIWQRVRTGHWAPQTVLWIFSLHGLRTLAVRVFCLVNRQSVFSPEASAVTSLLGVRQMPKSGE
jgi:hypothetical protein